jgi:hypothetical protein
MAPKILEYRSLQRAIAEFNRISVLIVEGGRSHYARGEVAIGANSLSITGRVVSCPHFRV